MRSAGGGAGDVPGKVSVPVGQPCTDGWAVPQAQRLVRRQEGARQEGASPHRGQAPEVEGQALHGAGRHSRRPSGQAAPCPCGADWSQSQQVGNQALSRRRRRCQTQRCGAEQSCSPLSPAPAQHPTPAASLPTRSATRPQGTSPKAVGKGAARGIARRLCSAAQPVGAVHLRVLRQRVAAGGQAARQLLSLPLQRLHSSWPVLLCGTARAWPPHRCARADDVDGVWECKACTAAAAAARCCRNCARAQGGGVGWGRGGGPVGQEGARATGSAAGQRAWAHLQTLALLLAGSGQAAHVHVQQRQGALAHTPRQLPHACSAGLVGSNEREAGTKARALWTIAAALWTLAARGAQSGPTFACSLAACSPRRGWQARDPALPHPGTVQAAARRAAAEPPGQGCQRRRAQRRGCRGGERANGPCRGGQGRRRACCWGGRVHGGSEPRRSAPCSQDSLCQQGGTADFQRALHRPASCLKVVLPPPWSPFRQ